MTENNRIRPIVRAAQGLVLSTGSPLGWLIIRLMSGNDITEELMQAHYLYMLVGTAIAFCGFGFYVGLSEQKLSDLSLQDALTGLYNKRFFHERLHEAFSDSIRRGKPISLIQIDLDHFKRVNDQYGHLVGDIVLNQVSQSMKHCSRTGESISRVGGEEFCVLLVDCNKEQAMIAANRFHQEIKQLNIKLDSGQELSVTVSLGVVCSEGFEGNEWNLYEKADEAMYQAKQNGRDQVVSA